MQAPENAGLEFAGLENAGQENERNAAHWTLQVLENGGKPDHWKMKETV